MKSAATLFIFLLGSTCLHAQDLGGDPEAGFAFARDVCAPCHAIMPGAMRSPNPQAPSFERIASVPGMTPLALTVALQTSHKTMPNLILEREDLRDVIAYIVSLQDRP